ncbi:MAG: hypothetical protein ACK476_01740, partial [Fluviicola sp.]
GLKDSDNTQGIHRKYQGSNGTCTHTASDEAAISAKFAHYLDDITTTEEQEYNEYFQTYKKCDLYSIPLNTRIGVIKELIVKPMPLSYQWGLASDLFRYVPTEQLDAFIEKLGEYDPEDNSNRTYLQVFFDRYSAWNDDQTDAWMANMLKVYNRYYKQNITPAQFDKVTSIILFDEEDGEKHRAGFARFINAETTSNGKIKLTYQLVKKITPRITTQFVGDEITQETIQNTVYDYEYLPEKVIYFDYDEPVVLIYKGELSVVSNLYDNGKIFASPAFILLHIDEVDFANTVNKVVAVAEIIVDIATIPAGYG